MRRPDQLSDQEVQRFLLHLGEECRLASSTRNQAHCALKFFYDVTVRRPQPSLTVPMRRGEQKLPEILSREEVERILEVPRNRKHRLLLMIAYGSGLRVSEVVGLRADDIDMERRLIRVEQGKGYRDRYSILASCVAREIAQYYAERGRPQHWLFASPLDPTRHIDASCLQRVYVQAKRKAGVTKHGGIHALRHAFATHALEDGLDLPTLARMLGHNRVTTTSSCCATVRGLRSPASG
jgi:site-specific recombinase XerD